MTSDNKVVGQPSKADRIKWGMAWGLILLGIVGNYYYSNLAYPVRLTAWLILISIAIGIASQTERGQQLWQLGREAQVELRKVVWPTRHETLQATMVVILMVTITALILWLVDSILLWGVSLLTG